jgi:hypothetical protein
MRRASSTSERPRHPQQLSDARGRARSWRSDVERGVRHGTRARDRARNRERRGRHLLAGMGCGEVGGRCGDCYKPSAIRSYATAVELRGRPDLGAMRLGDFKRRHVQRFADCPVVAEHASSTVRNALMPLRVIFRRALRDGLVAVNSCDGLELPRTAAGASESPRPKTRPGSIAALPSPFDRALWATAL